MNMGRNFLQARKRRGMSQKEASICMEIGTSFLSQIESGKKKPSVELIIKAAKLYGVNEGYFFNDQNEAYNILEIQLELDGVNLSREELAGTVTFIRTLRRMRDSEQCN